MTENKSIEDLRKCFN